MKKSKSKVILIVIDGCRPDGIQKATTPTLDRLLVKGSHSFNAKTVTPSLTLPAHLSIFSSRNPIGHNVLTNTGRPEISPDIKTILELAKYNGLSTAAFYSWEHLRNLAPPGVLDQSSLINTLILDETIRDRTIVETAAPRICRSAPDCCFIYLEGVDISGHEYGWMSEEYLSAINRADSAIEILLEALTESDLLDSYTILIVSDHGGSGTHHAEPVPEVMLVPWIAFGPPVKENFCIPNEMSVLDVTPTLAWLLDVAPHWEWEGRAIKEMLD